MSRLRRREFLNFLTLSSLLPQLAAAANIRVAVLDWALMETMFAIEYVPIAVVAASDWYRGNMGPRLPAGVADLGLSPEINFELLASLKPDLILMSPFVEQLEPALKRIAPTWDLSVFEPAESPLLYQRQLTQMIGARLGRVAATEQFLAEAERTLDQCRAHLVTRSARPVLLVNFIDARHVRVYGGNGLYQNVLDRIGLVNAWKGQTNYWGYVTVGIERLATNGDLHLIAFEPIPPDSRSTLQRSPLWSELPFVRAGHLSILPGVLMFGALPSALRLACFLDEYLVQ